MPEAAFKDVITTQVQIRDILGRPNERVLKKEITHPEAHSKAFIARSPFVLIASGDDEGGLDVSPKGDPAGFVRVLDDRTLAIPDRPGNRRADTLLNILGNSRAGLLFLIPGEQETLRVNGRAMIVREMRDSLETVGAASVARSQRFGFTRAGHRRASALEPVGRGGACDHRERQGDAAVLTLRP